MQAYDYIEGFRSEIGMDLCNPTGKGIRKDKGGMGYYRAVRDKNGRKVFHKGLDLSCDVGQPVRSPITGIFTRIAFPYEENDFYQGLLIEGRNAEIKLFYVKPSIPIGIAVRQGDVIGHAQDVGLRYPSQGVTPHVHVEISNLNPELFLKLD